MKAATATPLVFYHLQDNVYRLSDISFVGKIKDYENYYNFSFICAQREYTIGTGNGVTKSTLETIRNNLVATLEQL